MPNKYLLIIVSIIVIKIKVGMKNDKKIFFYNIVKFSFFTLSYKFTLYSNRDFIEINSINHPLIKSTSSLKAISHCFQNYGIYNFLQIHKN